jgi:hypothetical protein
MRALSTSNRDLMFLVKVERTNQYIFLHRRESPIIRAIESIGKNFYVRYSFLTDMYRLKFAVKMMMHFKAVISVHFEIIDR